MKRHRIWTGFMITLICGGIAPPAQGQEGGFELDTEDVEDVLRDHIVMVSIVGDGQVRWQKEIYVGYGVSGPGKGAIHATPWLPPGPYDIRIEGEGVVTEVKRGVHAIDGQITGLAFNLRPGEGLHVVEYAEGGLAREEVAVRLRALEASEATMEERLAALERQVAALANRDGN